MKNFLELFGRYRYKLQNISYVSKEEEDDSEPFSFYDEYKLLESNSEKITIDYTRYAKTNTGILFDLSITFRIEHFYNNDQDYDLDDYDIPEEIDSNIDFFSADLISKVSLLIAEITSNFGQFPIITNPSFTKE